MNVTIAEKAEINIEKLIIFLYIALGRTNKNTLIKAIRRGYLATCQGLSGKTVHKYIMRDIINAKEHMHLQREVKHKIKKLIDEQNIIDSEMTALVQEEKHFKTNLHFSMIEETGLFGTDLTETFLTRSKKRKTYNFVLSNYDTNSTIARSTKDRTDAAFVKVHNEITTKLTVMGVKPRIKDLMMKDANLIWIT